MSKQEWFDILQQKYGAAYETRIGTRHGMKCFEIVNPNWEENIYVVEENESELTFHFSYQHAHFRNGLDPLMAYIDGFLREKLVAIEFFKGEERHFGGSMRFEDIDPEHPILLVKQCGYKTDQEVERFRQRFKQESWHCRIRCWNPRKNMDLNLP